MKCIHCKVFNDKEVAMDRVGTWAWTRINNEMVKRVLFICKGCDYTSEWLERE